jgi:nucleoside-diphosphate-sugar epimerase
MATRASSYFGPGVREQGHIGQRTVPAVLDGRSVSVFGDADAAHSWTYVPDIATTLATLGTDERAWGRAWHVPSNRPASQREMLSAIARIGGAPTPRLRTLPGWAFGILGVVVPFMRELEEVRYQFEQPFVIDRWLEQRRAAA